MSVSRYPALAAELEKRIQRGEYRGHLPTVRALAAEFGTTRQTVSMALRPLQRRGLVVSEGRRGLRIVPQKSRGGLIGVVATGGLGQLANDQFLKRLQQQLRADGYESLLVASSNWQGPTKICRFLGEYFTGLIFTNSALTFEIAEYLDNRKIPFVSCNRLPVYPHLNYVENNWRGAIRQLAVDFAASGRRRLGLFFHGRLEGYNRLIRKEWHGIKAELGLAPLPCDDIELRYDDTTEASLEYFLRRLRGLRVDLDALLMWNGMTAGAVELLTRNPETRLPETTVLAGVSVPGVSYPSNVCIYEDPHSYGQVVFAAYDALRELLVAPVRRRIHRILDFPIAYVHQSPATMSPKEVQHEPTPNH